MAKFIGSLLVQWTRSGLIFMLVFIKIVSGIEDIHSASFGRGISDEVKLSYADDMGVWFFGLKVCNFRRILLSLLFTVSQGVCGSVDLQHDLAETSIYKALRVSRSLKKC